MAISKSIFINNWSKGKSENANIGLGTLVGIETYSKKGVAQLTKDSTKVSGSIVTDLIIFFAQVDDSLIFAQGDTGKVYKTINSGTTWTNITNTDVGSSGTGKGLFYFEGYLFAFRGTKIDYLSSPYTAADWTTDWQPNGSAPVLGAGQHVTFLFPNNGFNYFANGNMVGIVGFGQVAVFNPAGTPNTDYYYADGTNGTDRTLKLPSLYTVQCISFLPSNFVALGTGSSDFPQVADIILWNPTLSTYETPLRLYSQAPVSEGGVAQLINRNNVLYAVTGGSHSIFATNGTSFNLVSDISLNSNIRKPTGAQAQSPVFLNPKVSAIDVFGNKLLTGVATAANGPSYPTGYGLFPCGVWSLAFTDDGESLQCEYTISTNTTTAVQSTFIIGALKCLSSNQTLIAWQDNTNFGIDRTEINNFQNNLGATFIESEMLEIGTPLEPATPQIFQFNLPRNLMAGQTIQVNYRTSFDKDFTPFPLGTFTTSNNGISTGYKIQQNPVGATRFLQIQIQMETGAPSIIYSPEIRNIIIE